MSGQTGSPSRAAAAPATSGSIAGTGRFSTMSRTSAGDGALGGRTGKLMVDMLPY